MSSEVEPKTAALRPAPAGKESPATPPPAPPQLRLQGGKAFVSFGAMPLAEGVEILDLALRVPEVGFPFDIAGGAATRYQKRRCQFGWLDLKLEPEPLRAAAARLQRALAEHLDFLALHLLSGAREGEGLLHAPTGPVPFTFRVGLHPDQNALLLCVHDLRLFGPAPLPAPFLAALLTRAAARDLGLAGAEPFGALAVRLDPLSALVRRAVPLRGFRMPDLADARLDRVEARDGALLIRFEANAHADLELGEELLTAVEGARTFMEGERLLAQGDLAGAEAFYVQAGEAPTSHPFARERLLGLLAGRPEAHDFALDIAAGLRRERPGSAASYWAEASIRLARGQAREAGLLLLEVARLSRARGEQAGAFHAFAAAGRALAGEAPALASRALQDALVHRPDDYACLVALAEVADRANDAEGALRAYRRVAALTRDPSQAARAHVRIARYHLALGGDRAAARLHFDAALRRSPDDAEALQGLADLVRKDGELLRALDLLDRLRAAALAREDAPLQARACLAAARVREEDLGQLASALALYREALRLDPSLVEARLGEASALERLGHLGEALEAWNAAAVFAESGLEPQSGPNRAAAHRARRALARLCEQALQDPQRALQHMEAAVALDPDDVEALRGLLPHFRSQGRLAELARACERCASSAADPADRAALLAEAGTLRAGPLGEAERGEALLAQALLEDPRCIPALEALAQRAEARGDLAGAARRWRALCETDLPAERLLPALQRLARAARASGDLDTAARALERVAREGGDAAVEELCLVHRDRGDFASLASALSRVSQAREEKGDPAGAARALLELAELQLGPLQLPEEGFAALERAARLAPLDDAVLLAWGEAALRLSRPQTARQAFGALLALPHADGDRRLRARAGLGRACEQEGDIEQALAACLSGLEHGRADEALAERLDVLLAQSGRDADRARLCAARARASAGEPAANLFAEAAELYERLGDEPSARAAWEACLESAPQGPRAADALDALARAALAQGRPALAARHLEARAGLLSDGRAAARLLMRTAQLAEAGPDRAENLARAALARDASLPAAHRVLAEACLRRQDFQAALEHARAALRETEGEGALPPAEVAAIHRLGLTAARALGEPRLALEHALAAAPSAPEDRALLGAIADLQREVGDVQGLCETLPRLLALGATGTAAAALHAELGEHLGALGQQDAARRAFQSALEADPSCVPALWGLARTLDDAHAGERARALLRLAELSPDARSAAQRRAEASEALALAGETAEAAAVLAQAVEEAEDPAALLDRLAPLAASAGRVEMELHALERRARLASDRREPDAAARLMTLASRLASRGDLARALELLDLALAREIDPPQREEALLSAAELCERLGDRAAAAERLRAAARLVRGCERAELLLRSAAHFGALGEPAQARADVEAALRAAPGNRRVLTELQALCEAAGDWPACAAALQALAALPGGSRGETAAWAEKLGLLALHKLGDVARAESALRQALSLDRRRPQARQALFEVLVKRQAWDEALPLGEKLARELDRADEAAQRFVALRDLALEAGQTHWALRFARLARERDSGDRRIAYRLATLLYERGSSAEALALYRELAADPTALDSEDEVREVLLRTGELLLACGELAPGRAVLESLLQREPTCAAAADLLYAALRPCSFADAEALLASHVEALSPSSRRLDLFLRLAEDCAERGEAEKAAHYLARARKEALEPFAIDAAQGRILRRQADAPGLTQLVEDIASQALSQGGAERAQEALRRIDLILAPSPGLADAKGALPAAVRALLHAAAGEPGPAFTWARAAARESLPTAEGWRRLAEGARRAGHPAWAEAFERLIDPTKPAPDPATPSSLSSSIRRVLGDPMLQGPIARLLEAVAPFWPAPERPTPGPTAWSANRWQNPGLLERVERARRATGCGPVELWLVREPPHAFRVEPGSPCQIKLGLTVLALVDGAALDFLLLQACEQARLGLPAAALAGEEHLADLVRCAAAATGLPADIPEQFQGVARHLQKAWHPARRFQDTAREALDALGSLQPAGLLQALERSAARYALASLGDPGAALRALAATSPEFSGADLAAVDPGRLMAGERAADLVRVILQDEWNRIRAAERRAAR